VGLHFSHALELVGWAIWDKAILIVLAALCVVMIVFLGAWTFVAHLP